MDISENNRFIARFMGIVKHYNPKKYWKMRSEVVNPDSKIPKLIRLYYLFRIKQMDAYNNCSFGTGFGYGAEFAEPPILYHLLNGQIISYYAHIGKRCTIYQHVTIAGGVDQAVYIGDDVIIGAGAVIIGPVTIGNHVNIGANAVVTKDIPDNSTVVMQPMRIIPHEDRLPK